VVERIIHRAIARHAATRPTAPALVHGGTTVAFQTLDAAAGTYAAMFSERGITQGDIIPVLLSRSAHAVALQLGVLKCGAAYAGLDRRWPRERLESLLRWMNPPLLVLDPAVAREFPGYPTFIPPDGDLAVVAAQDRHGIPAAVTPDDPATVFFTSGTTGTPKGVVAPHRAIIRLFGPDGLHGFGPGHSILQAAPPGWDMYAFEVWGSLTSGATSVLTDGDYLMPGDLRRMVRDYRVTTVWLTTALFNLFVDEDPGCFTGLSYVYTGGEKLSPRHVAVFLEHHPELPLFNGYGPAESAMLTTTRRIRPEDCATLGGIPVGTPVTGTGLAILDDCGQPCPPDDVGEIWITGDGLAVGYLHDPELTARQFAEIVVGERKTRAYRTGDLGLIDTCGTLHFRGRADRQLKISGHRVEPAEVEAAARALPGVQDCAVVPIDSPGGPVTGMALFYLSKAGPVPSEVSQDPLRLRSQLASALPSYLVPNVVRVLDRFPVTINGKLDRVALTTFIRAR
jgi:D-alanine--poly(phosphoribitol) ligase subunit 1